MKKKVSKEGIRRIREAAKRGRETMCKNRKREYYENPTICEHCNKEISWENWKKHRRKRFCNKACAYASQSGKHLVPRNNCKNCGKETLNPSFCSNPCQGEYKKKKTNLKVEQGRCSDPRRIREYLIDKQGRVCQICKRKTWCGESIPLNLDHIDGNSLNNDLKNLRMICCNCDAQTDTYKIKNRGKGRHSRRLRYSKGKSY